MKEINFESLLEMSEEERKEMFESGQILKISKETIDCMIKELMFFVYVNPEKFKDELLEQITNSSQKYINKYESNKKSIVMDIIENILIKSF